MGRGLRNQSLSGVGAEGGIRTHTPVKVADFKSTQNTYQPADFPIANDRLIINFVQERRSRGLSPKTCQFYQGYLTRFLRMVHKPLLDVQREDITCFLNVVQCNPGGKHAYLRVLRAFFEWAIDTGLLTTNPCHKLTIRVPKPLRHAVRPTEIPTLLTACDSVRDKLIVLMLADTGLRLSELAGLRMFDLDIAAQTARVWGKGAKQRVVRYGPLTLTHLLQWLAERLESDTLLGLTERGVSAMLARLERRTGIKCNAHAFRRTFATESVRNDVNLFYMQSLLGHSSLTMTRIYAEQVNSEDAIKAYKPIVT